MWLSPWAQGSTHQPWALGLCRGAQVTAREQAALGVESRPGRRPHLPVPQRFTCRRCHHSPAGGQTQAARAVPSIWGALARGQPVPVLLAHEPLAVLRGCDFKYIIDQRCISATGVSLCRNLAVNDVLIVHLLVKVGSLHHRPDPEALVAAHVPW